MPDKWTVQQLAAKAAVHDSYIRKLIVAGKLRAEKFGRDWVIDDKEARPWLKGREGLPKRGRPRKGERG